MYIDMSLLGGETVSFPAGVRNETTVPFSYITPVCFSNFWTTGASVEVIIKGHKWAPDIKE